MTIVGSDPTSAPHTTSTGQALADYDWLDAHFEMCRPEYEAMVQSVGFELGWTVLDAGCGIGSYLPQIGDLVGENGTIHGIDLAPENVERAKARAESWKLPCQVLLQQGSILELPYADDYFDGVLCAATAQYLNDDELSRALQEFRRVVRPGGLIALKDYDAALERRWSGNLAIRWRMLDAWTQQDTAFEIQVRGWLRTGLLRRWLERAGLEDVWQRTVPIERWAPLAPVEQAFLSKVLARDIAVAEDLGLPESDIAYLRTQTDATAPEHALNDPDFHYCETHVVAVGSVPDAKPY
jgi:ubiquinone/menaquinone biosynthesis C-methylase UbiE